MFHDFVPCSSPAGCGSSDFSRHTISLHAAPCNIVDPESCICHYMLHRSVLGSFPSGGREDKKLCYFRAKHARQRCKTKFVHWELDLVLADICFMILRSRDEWTEPVQLGFGPKFWTSSVHLEREPHAVGSEPKFVNQPNQTFHKFAHHY